VLGGKLALTVATAVTVATVGIGGAVLSSRLRTPSAPTATPAPLAAALSTPTPRATFTPAFTPQGVSVTATSSPTPRPTLPAPHSTPPTGCTDQTVAGHARCRPVALGQAVETAHLILQVRSVHAPEEVAGWTNDFFLDLTREPPGYVTWAVDVSVQPKDTTAETMQMLYGFDWFVTGEDNVAHQGVQSEEVRNGQPGPWAPALLQQGQSYTQRVLFYVPEGETPLVLMHKPMVLPPDEPVLYLALQGGLDGRLTVPAELHAEGRSDVGLTASSPAAMGETVSAPPYEVQVLAVQWGAEASARLQAQGGLAYQPPAAGEEDVLVQVRVRNADAADEARPIAATPYFGVAVRGREVWEMDVMRYQVLVGMAAPEAYPLLTADESRLWLFPGGEIRDWVALRVPAGARDLVLVFDPQPGQPTSPRRYLALER